MAFYLPDIVISGAHTYGTIQHGRHLIIVTKSSRLIREDCLSYTCYYLCEEDVLKSGNSNLLTNASTKYEIKLAPPNSSLLFFVDFRFVQCPAGHVTQVYRADDASSHCLATGDAVYTFSCGLTHGDCSRKLVSLPDLFECANDAQHVPYSFVCDHRRDCLDDSDENFCVFPGCGGLETKNMFECDNREVYKFIALATDCCVHEVAD